MLSARFLLSTKCPTYVYLHKYIVAKKDWKTWSTRAIYITWVLKTRLMEKNTHHFLKPNCRKLQDNSKNVSPKIGSKGPKKLSQIFRGPKIPPEVRVQHETCSTICGTPVQAILNQKKLTGLAGGVKEGQNMAQNGPRFYIFLASEPSRSP